MSDTAVPTKGFIFSDALYQKAKWGVAIVLPAISTLYFTLGTIWGWPNIEQVVGSIAALTTFFGVLLGVSTRSYNASDARFDGSMDININDEGTKVFSLNLNDAPEALENMSSILFKVNSEANRK